MHNPPTPQISCIQTFRVILLVNKETSGQMVVVTELLQKVTEVIEASYVQAQMNLTLINSRQTYSNTLRI